MPEETSGGLLRFFAAGHSEAEKKIKKAEKERKKIDPWAEVNRALIIGGAGKAFDIVSDIVIDPIFGAIKDVGKEYFVDPYTLDKTTWLAQPRRRKITQANTRMKERFDANAAQEATFREAGQTNRQGREDLKIDQTIPLMKDQIFEQARISGNRIDVSKISDDALRVAARNFINQPRYNFDRSSGELIDMDIDELAADILAGRRDIIQKSILDLDMDHYDSFMTAIRDIPGGPGALETYSGDLADARLPSNMLNSAIVAMKNLVETTDIDKQIDEVVAHNILNKDIFKKIKVKDTDTGEITMEDSVAKKLDLTGEVRYLARIGHSIEDARERQKYFTSFTTRKMSQDAVEKNDMLNFVRNISTESQQTDEIRVEIADDGSFNYFNVIEIWEMQAGKKNIIKRRKEHIFDSNDAEEGRQLAKTIQTNPNFNLNNMLQDLLSEDGRGEVYRRVKQAYDESDINKQFLTDGTGRMLNEYSSDLTMRQYMWYADVIKGTFLTKGGKFALERAKAKSELLPFALQQLGTNWSKLQEVVAAYGDLKKPITDQHGVVYDDNWMFINNDRDKNDFNMKKFIHPTTGDIIKAAIPKDKLQDDRFTKEDIIEHMKNLNRKQLDAPEQKKKILNEVSAIKEFLRTVNVLTAIDPLEELDDSISKIDVRDTYIKVPEGERDYVPPISLLSPDTEDQTGKPSLLVDPNKLNMKDLIKKLRGMQ